MPSLTSVLMRTQIRLVKPLLKRLSIKTARTFQDNLGDIQARSLESKVVYETVEFGRFDACFVSPKKLRDDDRRRVVLYLHGGGYVAGNLGYARGCAGLFAVEAGIRVFAVAYRLAPEQPFPAALEDALCAYRYLIDAGYERIALVGESAGGGLVVSLGLKLKELELPMPDAMVCISPWADLTFSGGSYQTNRKKDPTLSETALREYAKAYAPAQTENPLVSPVLGDLCGLPRCLVIAGSRELLLDDARMLAARFAACGGRCELLVEEGLWHVYVLFGIPEARAAMKKIAAFLGDGDGNENA